MGLWRQGGGMNLSRDYERFSAWLASMKIRFCLFWGIAFGASNRSEDENRLFRADVHTRRRLKFIQKIPVRLVMAVPFGILCFTTSKLTLLVLLYVVGLLYVPLVVFVGFYFTNKLGHFDIHLRREYSRLKTGMLDRQR